jgi:nucleoside 2-deoxyribosyltransferase
MRVYVAAHDRWAACHVASVLKSAGHSVVSTWHDEDFLPTSEHTRAECWEIAERDVNQVRESDAVVLVAGPDKYSGGKFVEAGIAIGLNKVVVVLGRRENMLLYYPPVTVADDVQGVLEKLQ